MAEQTFRDIELKLLEVTNHGLDIIHQIYPQARLGKNFRIREDDRTESASMKLLTSKTGVTAYCITDFGGSISKENCFGIYALDKNLSYTEAVLELANDYQARGHQILETEKVIYKAEYREYTPQDFPHTLNDKGFHFITKDFTPFELGLLGPEIKGGAGESENGNYRTPLVTAEVCQKVNLYSLEEYSWLNKDGDKIHTFRSTDKFPILAFINEDKEIGQWVKIYKPRGGKKFSDDGKDYRFQHLGGRPADFVFGFGALETMLDEYRASQDDDVLDPEQIKLPHICLATGGSDGINLLALGQPVVWLNSETAKVDRKLINKLKAYAEEIINIPDCDATGKREGRDLALQYMDIRTLWLDTYFRNKNLKDFKDFCKENQSRTLTQLTKRVNEMMDASMPAKFWTSTMNEKSKRYNHNFSPTFAFYFLRLNGFCRVIDRSKKDGYYFARVVGNVVEEVDVTEIKNFFKSFLIEKQHREGVREVSHSLMDALITTPRFSDTSMAMLHDRELDFSDFEKDAQFFFLGDKVYKTTRTGTEQATFNRYVLKSQLLDQLILEATGIQIDTKKFKVDPQPYFSIKETGPYDHDVQIKETGCDFQNYIIQTSRVHWKKELAAYLKAGKKEEDFYRESRFRLVSPYLSDEENRDQMNHAANKIFTFGYMLHRYKDPTRPLFPWAVDEAVQDDDVAEGGAGKTIYFNALKYFCNFFEIPKSEDKDDKFKFEGITAHTDFVYYDDMDRLFDLRSLFSEITGGMTVNTKNVSRVKIPFALSPKMGGSSNYSIRHNEGSYNRRRLVLGFSDYYHAENKEAGVSAYEPKNDFKHRLFDDWQSEQWYKFINFGFQCLQFYLSQSKIIEAPTDNIRMRTYFSEMGVHFQEWADSYYPELIGETFVKDSAIISCQKHNIKFLGNISSAAFKKKTKAWCKVHELEFEDRIMENVDQYDTNGQPIMKNGTRYKKTTEHLRLTKLQPDHDGVEQGEYY